MKTIVVLSAACLAVTACKSYDSIEKQASDGRAQLEQALSESDVISWRSWGGGEAYVITDVQLGPERFCHKQLARWNDGPWTTQYAPTGAEMPAGWYPGRDGQQCFAYSLVDSAVPRDVRDCDGFDCLWMRGLGR